MRRLVRMSCIFAAVAQIPAMSTSDSAVQTLLFCTLITVLLSSAMDVK